MSILESVIRCPKCGFEKREDMLENGCQTFYRCTHCKEQIRAKDGDCCVFCSYGDTPCPTAQHIGSSCCGRD